MLRKLARKQKGTGKVQEDDAHPQKPALQGSSDKGFFRKVARRVCCSRPGTTGAAEAVTKALGADQTTINVSASHPERPTALTSDEAVSQPAALEPAPASSKQGQHCAAESPYFSQTNSETALSRVQPLPTAASPVSSVQQCALLVLADREVVAQTTQVKFMEVKVGLVPVQRSSSRCAISSGSRRHAARRHIMNVHHQPPYFPLQRYLSTHTHSISIIPMKSPTIPFDTNLSLAITPYTGPPTLTAYAADSFSNPRSVVYPYSITAPLVVSLAAASTLSPSRLLGPGKDSGPSHRRASTFSSSVVPFAYSQKQIAAGRDGTRLDLLAALLEHVSMAARAPASACLIDSVLAVNSRAVVTCDSSTPVSMYQTGTGSADSFRALQLLAALATAASASGNFSLTRPETAYAAHIIDCIANRPAVMSLLARTQGALMQPAQYRAQSSCCITMLGLISSASQLALPQQSVRSDRRMQLLAGPVDNGTTAVAARSPAVIRYYTKHMQFPLMTASSYGPYLPTSTTPSSPGVALLSMTDSATRTISPTLDVTYKTPGNLGVEKMPSAVAVFPLYKMPAVGAAFEASVAIEPVNGTVRCEQPVFASKVDKHLEMPWDSRQAFEQMAQKTTVECFKECWGNWRVGDFLSQHNGVDTFLSIAHSSSPCDTSKAAVLRMASRAGKGDNSMAATLVGREALLLHQCAHNGVVPLKFVGVQHPPFPLLPADPCLVEYFGMPVADITLDKLVGQEAMGKASSVMPAGPSITFAEIAGFASQILEALAQIHGCGVLHKGLVPKHVLLFSHGSHNHTSALPALYKVRLTGFQHAQRFSLLDKTISSTSYRHCPEAYRPPETASACILTTAADVYQFGGLLEFMVTGRHPADDSSLTYHGNGPELCALPSYVPQEWHKIIHDCRRPDPKQRPTVAELLACMMLLQHSPKESLLASDKSQAAPSSRLTPPAVSASEPNVQSAPDAIDGTSTTGLISAHGRSGFSRNSSLFHATGSKLQLESLVPPQHSKSKCRKAASFATFTAADKGHIWSAQAMPGLMDDIKPVTKLDFVTPGLLAAHRGAAGCKRYASAEEEIKPLLASRPRLLSSTDAWFPDLATIQRIEESTSGSPEAERVEVKDQSSHVQSASPVQPAGPHHEASQASMPVRQQRQSFLQRWDSDMFQAAVQQWLPSAGLDKLSSIAESPQAQQMKAHASKALQRCSSWKDAAVVYTTS